MSDAFWFRFDGDLIALAPEDVTIVCDEVTGQVIGYLVAARVLDKTGLYQFGAAGVTEGVS